MFAAVAPRIVNLRQDPFEFAPERNASWNYQEWMFRRGYVYVPAQGIVGGYVKCFKDYPHVAYRLASVWAMHSRR